MNNKDFLKELNKKLKKLDKKTRKKEIEAYETLDTSNLDATVEAKKIYQKLGISYLTFLEAVNILIEALKSNNKKQLSNLLGFFLYLILLIIFIKVPFIYIRDIIANLFNNLITNSTYTIWSLIIELLYTLTTIYMAIILIKKKAKEITDVK